MTRIESRYTPIWTYTLSGVNWSIDQINYADSNSFGEDYCCTRSGVNAQLIVSMASVVEGSMREYLRNKVINLDNLKKHVSQIETGEISSMDDLDKLKEEIFGTEQLMDHLTNIRIKNEIKNGKKIWKVLGIISPKFRKYCERRLKSKLVKKSQYKLYSQEASLELIEEGAWNKLKQYYHKSNTVDLMSILSRVSVNLFNDVLMLMKFRHFFVHARIMVHTENSVNFEDGSFTAIRDYLTNKQLYNTSEGYYIDKIAPIEIVKHFQDCVTTFLQSSVYSDDSRISNSLIQVFGIK
ncbi:MAG: hypothetical protein JJ975_01510 [Bacteroidia bacterium]|nr:hypothetical protein [Bacteroidia bacterium]